MPKVPYVHKDFDSKVHVDPSVPIQELRGFHELCKGCEHTRVRHGSRQCVYVNEPRKRKFPCFFREHVPKGGFDGKYGATVNNYIKAVDKSQFKKAKDPVEPVAISDPVLPASDRLIETIAPKEPEIIKRPTPRRSKKCPQATEKSEQHPQLEQQVQQESTEQPAKVIKKRGRPRSQPKEVCQ